MSIYRSKFFAAVAALVIPLTASAAPIRVIINGETVVFSDVQEETWFAPYVRAAAEAGIVSGYKDSFGRLTGKFGPSNNITIAEALKIAIEAAGYDAELYGSMVDSGMRHHWASMYVSVAKSENFAIFAGGGRLNIDRNATRAEVASIFTSAFRVNIDTSDAVDTRYDDVSTQTQYAGSIEALSRDEIVAGDTDIHGQATGTFRPMSWINRAEVAKIAMNARAQYSLVGQDLTPSQGEGDSVSYTNEGFSVSVLRVSEGTTVTFRNDSGMDLWVASDPHPSHTNLSGFNSNGAIGAGETYSYTFDRLGTWGYHNHLKPSHQATIIVE